LTACEPWERSATPEKFTAAFAARLNSLSALEVREAQNNDRVSCRAAR
jgi:chemotaxis response regulator CheB